MCSSSTLHDLLSLSRAEPEHLDAAVKAPPAEVEPSADASATETQLAAAGETSKAAGASAAHRWQCAAVIEASAAITLEVVPLLPLPGEPLLRVTLDAGFQYTGRASHSIGAPPPLGCGALGVCGGWVCAGEKGRVP